MNDRELLELAAKAAGFGAPVTGAVCWTISPRAKGLPSGCLWNYVGHGDSAELWNPLTDDGDALRLAASVCMEVTWCSALRHVTVKGFARGGIWINIIERYQEGDLMKATRRAIVRAAAEIGKAMP